MAITTHYENANFLRELAENLPRIFPTGSTDKMELLQRLAIPRTRILTAA